MSSKTKEKAVKEAAPVEAPQEAVTTLSPTDLTKNKFEQWGMANKPIEEQVEFFRSLIPMVIAETTQRNQSFESVLVPEPLFEAAKTAFSDPGAITMPVEDGVDPNETAQNVLRYLASIVVRHAPIEVFANPNLLTMPPELHFVQFVTTEMRMQQWLHQWFGRIGLGEVLRADGYTFGFTLSELKLMYGMLRSLEAISRFEDTQVMAAKQAVDAPKILGIN